jgi:hypothetical protein
MRSFIALGFLGASSMALFASGCAMSADAETESVGQTAEALSVSAAKPKLAVDRGAAPESAALSGAYTTLSNLTAGTTLFDAFPLYQNCKLTVQTSGASSTRNPVVGLIINNGNGAPWGSSSQPCHRGYPTATDGYNTLAYNENMAVGNYNSKVAWKNPSGGDPVTVFAAGSLKSNSSNPGTLTVNWTITGCNDSTKNNSGSFNRDFQSKGAQGTLPGNVYTTAGTCSDPTLYELDTTVPADGGTGGGSGSTKCNDDSAAGGTYQSRIDGNSGSSFWYFSTGYYCSGTFSVNN